jgi:hypothetical protein
MIGMTSMETLCNLGCIKGIVAVVDRLLRAVVSPNNNYRRYGMDRHEYHKGCGIRCVDRLDGMLETV